MINYADNNSVKLIGTVVSEKIFGHNEYGEKFYFFDLDVSRLCGISNVISVTVSERLLDSIDYKVGKKVAIDGQIRSYYNDERHRYVTKIIAKKILEQVEEDAEVNTNEIMLNGFICNKPLYSSGRTYIILSVNRVYNKSDYIKCIAWGENARYCKSLEAGANIKIWGRIQSSKYEKKFEDGTLEIGRIYEVLISKMEVEEVNSNLEKENT